MANKLKEFIAQMILEEKASLCSGGDFWHTKVIERLGIPKIMLSDGPHGLRKQENESDHLGINESIKAVCFPAGCATAASFNRELLTHMGEVIGNESQAVNVGVVLGPAVNIKRSPLCGRNFEYYSEDPYVASEMAAAFIKGVQSKNVGTSIKHFLANNQEHRRMTSSSEVDERTLREIYLAAFEGAVVKAKPWTVMASYNKINGVYAAENKQYLTDVLRTEWGFDGLVVSDWGATNNRVPNLAAGMDLEMPSSYGWNDQLIVEAVKNGSLSEEIVDTACERILNIVFKYQNNRDTTAVFDLDKDHEVARKIAEETIVLLKNEDILPLNKSEKIAFIGHYAKKPRFQGGGSSHINSHKVISAMDYVAGMENITYAQGFDESKDVVDEVLLQEAVAVAQASKIAVIFAGLPDSYESEGYDRTHLHLPESQNELIRRVCQVQTNTVIVLHNGSPIEMPWINDVKGILETYLSGQAVGAATVDILFGDVNPSAKLAESFPIQLEDNPSYPFYFGEKDTVEYREGVFVGYRYYDVKKMNVLFPFGHGLSYTTFEYSHLRIDKTQMKDTDTLKVYIDVTNTGKRAGKEVVQLYVSDKISTAIRPVKELRDFAKISLQPGETKTVEFELSKRAFAYWNTLIHDWHVESGEFEIIIGKSSRNLVAREAVFVQSTVELPHNYTLETPLGDLLEDPFAASIMQKFFSVPGIELPTQESTINNTSEAISQKMLEAMMKDIPVKAIIGFSNGTVDVQQLMGLLELLNKGQN